MVSWRTPSTRRGSLEGSEKEKMLSGELYRASDPELVRERQRCRSLLQAFNTQPG